MNHQPHESHVEQRERRGFRLDFRWVLLGFLLIGGYFLFTEHRAHAINFLPFVLLALCPLMHLFHDHGGTDKHGTHRDDGEQR